MVFCAEDDRVHPGKAICLDVILSPQNRAGQALAAWLFQALIALPLIIFPRLSAADQNDRARAAVDSAIAQGREFSLTGRKQEASESLEKAAAMARRAGYKAGEAKALLGLSGCRIRLFDYRGAQESARASQEIAFRIKDDTIAGSASVNLATVYLQLGDFGLAAKEASAGADLLKNSPNQERLVKALLIYANVEAEGIRSRIPAEHAKGDTIAERGDLDQLEQNYRRGVTFAHAAGLAHLEANLWEELGYSLLLVQHPRPAEEPLHKAFLLESESHDQDALAVNEEHQAELELQKGDYHAALTLIDQAFASRSPTFKTTPQFYPLHIRGILLTKLNRESEALIDLRKAVDTANEWRQGALPGDVTTTRTVVVLHDVYHDYAQLAADLSLSTHNPELAREALEVLAENRAANLREQIALALSRKQRLPQHYYDLLSELQAAQARVTLGDNRPEDKQKLEQIRLEIDRIENTFGLKPHFSLPRDEKNRYQNSLRDIQGRLTKNEVLLSFSLDREKSFLWAVTEHDLQLYRLASSIEIADLAKQFSQAVQRRQDIGIPGRRLSQELFSSLPVGVWRRPEWLIVGDGVLLSGIHFASIPDLSSGRAEKSLAEMHDIRFLPGELLLLSTDKERAQRRFVGVGDPIYNMADSRRKKVVQAATGTNRASVALSRLAGSDHEIRTAAKESGMAKSDILVGQQATVAGLQKAIARRPEILHFAVHVVSPEAGGWSNPGQSSQAALALSLTKDNMPELLTPEAIATLRVPGSLVILSGCSSQKGDILPSAGLMGLSRAWLLAGASAVVVSAWPTPDDSGRFFSSFYSHFDADPSGTLAERAALALQQAQVEMEHGDGYRSSPRFWAAYSIISKE